MQILQKINDESLNYSLKQNVYYRFEEIFNDIRERYQNVGSFILIVDKESLKILSSALKMADLLKMGVSSIEKLELVRKQHPTLHAIYIISPCKESVQRLVEDFSPGLNMQSQKEEEKKAKPKKDVKKKKKKKNSDEGNDSDNEILMENLELKKEKHLEGKKDDKKKPDEIVQYGRVHVFFTSKLPKGLLGEIAQSEKLVKRIRTMKELNHNFYFVEQNAFHLNLEQSLSILFSRKESEEARLMLECIGERLLSVLPALLRFNSIKLLYNGKDSTSLSAQFANNFERKLQEYLLRLKQSDSKYIDLDAGQVVIVILDRSLDAVTPLLHDYSYQSMIYDLLDIDMEKQVIEYEKVEIVSDKNEKLKGENEQESKKEIHKYKQQLSDDKDEVFSKFRYCSITHSLNGIKEDFVKHTELMQKATSKNELDEQPKRIEDVQKIIRQYPQYKEMLSKYELHFDLILRCYNKFMKWKLEHICELEQSMVTGTTDEGKRIQNESLYPKVIEVLSQQNFQKSDRLRIALIAYLTLNLTQEQRNAINKLLEMQEQKLLKNLQWLGLTFPDDNKSSSFSKVLDKLIELSLKQYQEYLTKSQSCSRCKKIQGDIKKSKIESNRNLCDECGQLYYQFSVMRHTPLSAFVLHSIIKTALSPSQQSKSDQFGHLGFSQKVIEQNSKKFDLIENDVNSPPLKSQENVAIEDRKIKPQKQKKDIPQPETGDLRKINQNFPQLYQSVKDEDDFQKSTKIIAFFLGGVSYAEIRAIRQFQGESFQKTPIIIGGTHILTPHTYIQGLEQMTTFG